MRTRLSTSCTRCENFPKAHKHVFMYRSTYSISSIPGVVLSFCVYSSFRYSRGVMSPGRHVRTRLYFTSESHVHSLLSIFRYGGLLDVRSGFITFVLSVFRMRACALSDGDRPEQRTAVWLQKNLFEEEFSLVGLGCS